ncbi:MAG: acetate--CoA ligase family protein [Desulfohalobiaceae bacterium]|nr:acetate--CoA ligase family protein [Desulfohalobiaceae bacterium]
MHELDAIFSPSSVAVVGASTTPGKVGHDIFKNILRGGFSGVLYPVNPGARSVLSVKAYPGLEDIPDEVDLVIVILPPRYSLQAVEQAARKGVKGIVIVSAGFREVGGEGLEIENRIVKICARSGIRLIGPNCLGVINPVSNIRLNASFSTRMPSAGNISFISQSGALCTSVLDVAADRDFGFSKFISIGNKADVDELDLLQYLHQDPDTDVIMMYIEELRRGPEFITAVKDITAGYKRTPILAIKSGRTLAGAAAASSHTGSLAGSEAVYDAIFEQSGIIRVESINDLFDYAGVFTYKQESKLGKISRKLPAGNRVAIVTNAGGPGIVATDMTVSSGLQLARFHEETKETLASHLPVTANLNNPVDIIGDAAQERYENALRAVVRDEGVDGALVILTPQSMTNALATAEAVVKVARDTPKPVLCCFMGVVDVSQGVKYLQKHGYPVFRFPENAARAFGVLYRYSQWLNRQQLAQFKLEHDRERATEIISECLKRNKTKLGELDGLRLLECYGFDVLPTELAPDSGQAGQIAAQIGFPVVMKIVSEDILHKSDAGGVVVGIESEEEAVEAFEQIIDKARSYDPKAKIEGVLIQKLADPGEEVILGMNRYPIFGPLIMFGFGGIFVEVFKDVQFRLAPVDRNEARSMIRGIKGYKLLTGFRGRARADVEKIEKLLVSLSDMAVNHPEIMEMDLNPLLVHSQGQGATVADCRIILQET